MKCALVGNQNSGKSLLFNDLTGLNQKVGNWAGVTIERKEGIIKGTDIEIVDLPGIYSLSPYTSEEEVSRKFIIEEKPDLIINIIDSTSIERSLYLTTQLLELGIDVVIVLNMEDILKKRGYKLDIKQLENYLHTSCYSISALKNTGIKELVNAIKNKEYKENSNLNIFNSDIEEYIKRVELCLPSEIKERRFSAIKLLENDVRYNSLKEQLINNSSTIEVTNNYLARVKCDTLNCRSGAGTNYPVVRQIHKGTVITIVATNGDWLQAKMGYWVHKNYMEYIRKV